MAEKKYRIQAETAPEKKRSMDQIGIVDDWRSYSRKAKETKHKQKQKDFGRNYRL